MIGSKEEWIRTCFINGYVVFGKNVLIKVITWLSIKSSLRPFRAYIQLVDNYTGRCPVLLMMPLQGILLYFCLSPVRALALAQGIALGEYVSDQI